LHLLSFQQLPYYQHLSNTLVFQVLKLVKSNLCSINRAFSITIMNHI
jgi:hypothetical protein